MDFWLLVYSVYSNPELLKSAFFNSSFALEDFLKENKINICSRLIQQIHITLEFGPCDGLFKRYQFDDGVK